ncbi:hypothetical protein VKT23_012056 [Stygiomarasmius scandens]|uniref:Uncharacterized protein n=1 Tax=Marasmiellus scandens TaxID=2682957 RepID=A0ABR1JCA1_9AGAR
MGERDKPDPSLILHDSTRTRKQTSKAQASTTGSGTHKRTGEPAAEQCAVDENGALKDADQIDWYDSESGDSPISKSEYAYFCPTLDRPSWPRSCWSRGKGQL